MKKYSLVKIGAFMLTGALFVSCDPKNGTEVDPNDGIDSTKIDTLTPPPPVGTYDNAIFSIPSPIQLSSIIKNSGAAYDATLLNSPSKVNDYTTLVSQSLNLGLYGADLGYSTLYDNQQSALKYMKSAKKLSDILGISDIFDNNTLDQIERSLNNKDSLLYLVSNTYRKADDYLQVSKRKHIGALIIVGGWIESMYFTTQIGLKQPDNKEIQHLVGMQKHTLNTLLEKMLIKYLNEDGVTEVFENLEVLLNLYDNVNIKYEYVPSVHDRANKVTTIKSKSSVEISKEDFEKIANQIKVLRTQIVQ